MEKHSNDSVPYIVYESAQAKSERIAKRLVIALVVAVVLIFVSNMAWLYAWSGYDYMSTSTTMTKTYTQDGYGFNLINDVSGVDHGTEIDGAQGDTDALAEEKE